MNVSTRLLLKYTVVFVAAFCLAALSGGCDDDEKTEKQGPPDSVFQPIGPKNIQEKVDPLDENSPMIYEPPADHYKVVDVEKRFVIFVPNSMEIKAQNAHEIYFSKTRGGIEYLQPVDLKEVVLEKGEKAKTHVVKLFEPYKAEPGYTTTKSSRIEWPFVPGGKVWQVRGRWKANENRLEWFTVIAFEYKSKLLTFSVRQDATRFGIFDEFLMDLHNRMLPPPNGGFPVDYRKDVKTYPTSLPGSFVPADKLDSEKKDVSEKKETDQKGQ